MACTARLDAGGAKDNLYPENVNADWRTVAWCRGGGGYKGGRKHGSGVSEGVIGGIRRVVKRIKAMICLKLHWCGPVICRHRNGAAWSACLGANWQIDKEVRKKGVQHFDILIKF